MAHEAGMLCLADEAHGTHFYFGGGLPVSAMAAGADMASVSTVSYTHLDVYKRQVQEVHSLNCLELKKKTQMEIK